MEARSLGLRDDCNTSINKDADIEEWAGALDNAVMRVTDPVKRWLRMRGILLRSGMELFDVFSLEQAYIEAVRNRKQALRRNS